MFAKVAWIDVESFEEEMRQPICRRKTTLCGNLGERCRCLLQLALDDFKSSVKYGLVYRLSVHLLKAQIKKSSGDAYMFSENGPFAGAQNLLSMVVSNHRTESPQNTMIPNLK